MSFENLLGYLSDLKHEVKRLQDEHISKSNHKKQMKKLKKLQENESTLLQRIDKLTHENEKYKKEIITVTKLQEHAEIQLKTAEETIATLHRGFKEREQSNNELRDENGRLQNDLEETKNAWNNLKQGKNLQKEYIEKKLKAVESKNGELDLSLKENEETIRNLKEELKILEYKNLELETNKKGLTLQLKQKKRHFDSLSAESPELAKKICKQQGYAVTSDCPGQPIIKMEPDEIHPDTKDSIKNFTCRYCYADWLATIPFSGRVTSDTHPFQDKIKTCSSRSELEDHIWMNHMIDECTGSLNVLKWEENGSTYICKEPDSKNGSCSFKTNSQDQYNAHLKLDHAKIHSLKSVVKVYSIRKYLGHLESTLTPDVQRHVYKTTGNRCTV